MEQRRQSRPNRIDRDTANAARGRTKAVLRSSGDLADLSHDELLVLLADITAELNRREPEAGTLRFYGPLRHFARRILE